MTFGENLKKERKRAGLTQGELADLLGVGKTTIINWEHGKTCPQNKEMYSKIIEVLNGWVNEKEKLAQAGFSTMVIQFKNMLDDPDISLAVKKNIFLQIQDAFLNYMSISGPAG